MATPFFNKKEDPVTPQRTISPNAAALGAAQHAATTNAANSAAASQPAPYAMRYSDEAAQALGVKDGKWEAFTPSSVLLPRVNGSLDSGRPMVSLQWRPNQ